MSEEQLLCPYCDSDDILIRGCWMENSWHYDCRCWECDSTWYEHGGVADE